jgi:DivIVA domain-containing protein
MKFEYYTLNERMTAMAEQSLTALSTSDILEKEFRTELRGYSTNEVDDFLDEIISDYVKLYKEVERLTSENEKLTAQLQAKPKVDESPTNNTTNSNYDILKRVSLLEKQVVEIMNHLKKRAEHEKMRQAAAAKGE